MYSFTIEEVRAFQQAATEVYSRGTLLRGTGICSDLRGQITYSRYDNDAYLNVNSVKCSYDIMRQILTAAEYNQGLGPYGEMNPERMAFLAFFATMPEKDLLDYLNMD